MGKFYCALKANYQDKKQITHEPSNNSRAIFKEIKRYYNNNKSNNTLI